MTERTLRDYFRGITKVRCLSKGEVFTVTKYYLTYDSDSANMKCSVTGLPVKVYHKGCLAEIIEPKRRVEEVLYTPKCLMVPIEELPEWLVEKYKNRYKRTGMVLRKYISVDEKKESDQKEEKKKKNLLAIEKMEKEILRLKRENKKL